MADYNIQMSYLNAEGEYDILYPEIDSTQLKWPFNGANFMNMMNYWYGTINLIGSFGASGASNSLNGYKYQINFSNFYSLGKNYNYLCLIALNLVIDVLPVDNEISCNLIINKKGEETVYQLQDFEVTEISKKYNLLTLPFLIFPKHNDASNPYYIQILNEVISSNEGSSVEILISGRNGYGHITGSYKTWTWYDDYTKWMSGQTYGAIRN